jgi:peptidyl-prolyl cis-trans isomerase D
MATLQKIRDKGGVIVAVVIGLALLSFILSDFLNKGSLFSNSEYNIAEINGKNISFVEFQNKIDYLTKINSLYSGQNSFDEQTLERIREQTWQQLVRENVLDKEYEKLGISVDADEVWEMIQGKNPHPYIQQLFTDPKTGTFDQANVIRFLKSMDRDETGNSRMYWVFLENEIVNERLFTKYNNLILKGLYVTDSLAAQTDAENSLAFDLDFIVYPYSSYPDSLIKYTTKDLKTYYEKHKKEHKQEPSRSFEYVIFNVTPSSDDVSAVTDWINKHYNEFINSKDPKEYVSLNSDEPFDEKYYKKEELSDTLREFMFNSKEGASFGPYFENNSYKISKLVSIKMLPDSVKARHILITPTAEANGDTIAKMKADSIKNAIQKGSSFAELAKKFSKDPGSAEKGGDLGWFKEGMMVKPFNDACFNGKEKELMVVKSPYGYHIIEILEKGKSVKKVQIATLERKLEPSNTTIRFYYSKADAFAGQNTTIEAFRKTAAEQGLLKYSATDVKDMDKEIPGITSAREIIRWAYESKLGQISKVFELENKFVVAILTDIKEKGYVPYEDLKPFIINEVKKEKIAKEVSKIIESKKKSANNLNTLAQSLQLTINHASNILFSSYALPNAGFEPKVIAASSVLPKGTISKPIEGYSGVYVVEVTSKVKQQGVGTEFQKINLSRRYQSKTNYEAYETLKELAGIKDFRGKFF